MKAAITALALLAILVPSTAAGRGVRHVPKRPDLAVSVVAVPKAVAEGSRAHFIVIVDNGGRRKAKAVSLVGIDPNADYCPGAPLACGAAPQGSIDFLSATPTQGACTKRPQGFACSLGTIAPDGFVGIVVTTLPHRLPLVQGASWLASAIGLTPERVYANNVAVATVKFSA